jgi:endonuclease YncB( thermonuclease family)
MTPKLSLLLTPALFWPWPAGAGSQKLVLHDGDSFALGGAEIRLWGIDAPEFFQTCRNQAGQDYACGRQAKNYLQELIGRGSVRCEPTARAKRETRTVARCFVGAGDLGQLMVRGGWAVEYRYFSKGAYTADEQQAKNSKRGLWSGTFQNPRDWRNARENRR